MIAVIGEALIDLVQLEPGVYRAIPGGAPANVAIGLARLGVETAFVGRLGQDVFSGLSRERLAEAGVDLTLSADATEPSSVAVVSVSDAGVPSYSFYVTGTADSGFSDEELGAVSRADVGIVHVGSVAHTLEPSAGAIRRLASAMHDAGDVIVSYDPNVRPALGGDRLVERDRVEWFVAHADIVKVSDEDLAWLYPGSDPRTVASHWAASTDRLVVLTRGAEGATAFAGWLVEPVEVAGRRVTVVDTVGAGDTFCAALLAGLAPAKGGELADSSRAELVRALDTACAAAALACTKAGAEPPTRSELDAFLAEHERG